MLGAMITVRDARLEDESDLALLDAATWAADVSPAPPPPVGSAFFDERTEPCDVLVAELDGEVVGDVRVGQPIRLASHAHVLELQGLAVDPVVEGRGIGRRLLDASVDQARERGARKLSLRVLAPNSNARRLYESAGFVVEGVLRAEFHLDGHYVDDVLMARHLAE